MKEKYPDVKIVLIEQTSDKLRKKAEEEKVDFSIVNLPVDESLFNITPIEQDKLVLVVPKNMVSLISSKTKEQMSKVDFKACENLPFIVVGKNQEMRMLFEKICTASDIQPKIAMEVVGLTTAWAMAREGIGATLLPLQFINSMENSESISLFVPDCDANIRQPAIITRHGQYVSGYAKYAIDILTKE